MKQGLTEIVMVLDRSGSMGNVWGDAVGGIKRFIEDQKKELGQANLTLVLFDEPPFDTVYLRTPIKEVDTAKLNAFSPRGFTALLKAVSDTVDVIGQKLSEEKEEDRPEHVIVVVQTDGHENASNSGWVADGQKWAPPGGIFAPPNPLMTPTPTPPYTKAKLKEKLDIQHNTYKWEIIFLGADAEAFDDGVSMGATVSAQYNATKVGTQAMYAGLSKTTSAYRTTGEIDTSELDDLKDKK